jgi:hypothetical protein
MLRRPKHSKIEAVLLKEEDVIAVKEIRNRLWQHHDAVLCRTQKHFTSECVEPGRLYSSVSVLSGQLYKLGHHEF